MLGGMRLKFLRDDCHALCETATEAARVGCSTITTVKRPTTKCSTAQRNTSYIFTLLSSILRLKTIICQLVTEKCLACNL